jgi:hypothetical protein
LILSSQGVLGTEYGYSGAAIDMFLRLEGLRRLLSAFIGLRRPRGHLCTVRPVEDICKKPRHQPEEVPGSEGFKNIAFFYRAAFPDLMLTIDDMVGEVDKVAAKFTTKVD